MTVARLLRLANLGYPDRYLANYFRADGADNPDGDGDTLAQFIVRELRDTYDSASTSGAQLRTAIHALERAKRDLAGVIDVLTRAAESQQRRTLKRHI